VGEVTRGRLLQTEDRIKAKAPRVPLASAGAGWNFHPEVATPRDRLQLVASGGNAVAQRGECCYPHASSSDNFG
jgi:hypothetical protein